jgi:Arc/MetJ-type ribon-helix-helix transcriptional regulator
MSGNVRVTLDETELRQIRSLVHAGATPDVSAFVRHAVAMALDDLAEWDATLAETLRQAGGPLSDRERAWAGDVLGTE